MAEPRKPRRASHTGARSPSPLAACVGALWLIGCGGAGGQTGDPDWTRTGMDRRYPQSAYLTAVGAGTSRMIAQSSAFGQLAAQVRVKVEGTLTTEQRALTRSAGGRSATVAVEEAKDRIVARTNLDMKGLAKVADAVTTLDGRVSALAIIELAAARAHYQAEYDREKRRLGPISRDADAAMALPAADGTKLRRIAEANAELRALSAKLFDVATLQRAFGGQLPLQERAIAAKQTELEDALRRLRAATPVRVCVRGDADARGMVEKATLDHLAARSMRASAGCGSGAGLLLQLDARSACDADPRLANVTFCRITAQTRMTDAAGATVLSDTIGGETTRFGAKLRGESLRGAVVAWTELLSARLDTLVGP